MGNEKTIEIKMTHLIVTAVVLVVVVSAVLIYNATRPKTEIPETVKDALQNKDIEVIQDTPKEDTPVVQVVNGASSNSCGDNVCGRNENYASCPQECISTCGDGIVDPEENWKNCRSDILVSCGDNVCDDHEHYRYCPEDCEECVVDDKGTYTGENKCPPSPRWVN